jgi:kynurenine formamidase
MCVPGCHESIAWRLNRRRLFVGGAAMLASTAVMAPRAPAFAQSPRAFSRVIDLTHTLPPDFPTFDGEPGLSIDQAFTFATDGYNLGFWRLNEHTGTHLDAPIHFSADGQSADAIPVENLVVPLAVIDISAKAEGDPDAQVTADDIRAWIAANGAIPDGACVAMRSGWDRHVTNERFRNADEAGFMHFPGFHAEAAALLMEEANVVGIAVDTLSLDHGASADFATHYAWLPTNRWGLECVANLGDLPATGATLVVGAPKIQGATGGPSRVIALI